MKAFICFYISEVKPLFVLAFVHKCLMLNDVEYTTFKMFVTQISNYLFVISFQLMFHKTSRYRLARALEFGLFFKFGVITWFRKQITKFVERKFQGRSKKFYEVPDWSFEVSVLSFILSLEVFHQSFEVRGHAWTVLTIMNECGWNAFGHVSSVAGNTKNKSASFSCLDMGTGPLFRVFPLFKRWIIESPKIFKQIIADLSVITKKDHQTNVPSFIEIRGTKRQWLENSQFFSSLQTVAFWNSKRVSRKASLVNLNLALNYNLWSVSFKMSSWWLLYTFSVIILVANYRRMKYSIFDTKFLQEKVIVEWREMTNSIRLE